MEKNKLRARWSKSEKDVLFTYPLGVGTKCDGAYLADEVFNKEFIQEMIDRGYDIKTLKFEIKINPEQENFEKKFPSLSKEYFTDNK